MVFDTGSGWQPSFNITPIFLIPGQITYQTEERRRTGPDGDGNLMEVSFL
jgi:hypothetical protein